MKFFPGSSDDSLIAVEYDRGGPFVHLLRPRSEAEGGGSELLWCCELERCQGLIRLCGWSADGAAVFGDAYGCFYLVDFQGRQCRLLKHCGLGFRDARGVVSSDGRALLVLFERSGQVLLQRLWLDGAADPALVLDLYDDDCFGGGYDYRDEDEPCFSLSPQHRLYAGPDNSLILHCVDEDYDEETEVWLHFQYLVRLDLVEGRPRYRVLPLATPPEDWQSGTGAVGVCPALGMAAVPVLGEEAVGIEWVDLHNGARSVPVWVRRSDDESALDRLNASLFSQGEKALWLGWEDGLVRRVGLDGGLTSPLLQAQGELLRGGPSLLFDCHFAFAVVQAPEPAGASLEQTQELLLQEQDCRGEWQLKPEQQWQLNRLGRTCIRVEDLDDPAQRLVALEQLQQLTQDSAALRRDRTIAFLFEDGRQQWDEARFFGQAVTQPETHPLMCQVLLNFSQYPDSESCLGGDYKPPLADCALQLGLVDAHFLPVVSEYLYALDNDHDGFFVGEGDGLYQLQCRHEQEPRWQAFYESQPYYECYEEEEWDD